MYSPVACRNCYLIGHAHTGPGDDGVGTTDGRHDDGKSMLQVNDEVRTYKIINKLIKCFFNVHVHVL